MSFEVAAESYDRFMGRYSTPLAPEFADFAGVHAGQRALDVGCGPGALTGELVRRLGASSVAAADPSTPFVEAARERFPETTVEHAPAERMPFDDDGFDAALAQLVVHFMTDPLAGLREMARVTRPSGVVAACVWDHTRGGHGPLSLYWEVVQELEPDAGDESELAGAREGQLSELFLAAGIRDVVESQLVVSVEHPTFDDWWEPYTLGVGPAGSFASSLDSDRRTELRERCRQRLPEAPFTIAAHAWVARGLA
jgi:SAM-dependent methyltransferase